jgi:hypothetical protein
VRQHYDGLNRRIEKVTSVNGSYEWGQHYYYNTAWQVIEDREVSDQYGVQSVDQYVWSAAFGDAPGCVAEGFATAREETDARYAGAANTAMKAVQYPAEMVAHTGVRLGEVGMIGYVAATAGPVGPAIMKYQSVRVVLTGVGVAGTTHQAAVILSDVSSGRMPGAGDVVDLGLCASGTCWTASTIRLPVALGSAGLGTNANEAVFWSGIRNGETTAALWAGRNTGATLESTMAARGVKLPAWDPSNPASVAAWRQASQEFAAGARGNVRVLQGNAVRVHSVWAEVEYPALKANPNVKSIISINPATGQEVLLWSQ